MVLYHGIGRPPKPFLFTQYCESSRRETCVFMGKTQLVPAGYVVNKNGLGGSVWVPNKIETPILSCLVLTILEMWLV